LTTATYVSAVPLRQRQSAHCCCEVQELLGQTSHYSERVRKDALTGMAELLARHPEELRRQVGIE